MRVRGSRWHSALTGTRAGFHTMPKGPASISLFDMYSVGIGPSSSHTVGPMRASRHWATQLEGQLGGDLSAVSAVRVALYGSLAATGEGHSTPLAIALGLAGHLPATVDPVACRDEVARVWASNSLQLLGKREVHFGRSSIHWQPKVTLPLHSNGMTFTALDKVGATIATDDFYSIGGGFFVDREGLQTNNALAMPGQPDWQPRTPRFPFHSATELMEICAREKLSIAEVALANETAWTPEADIAPKMLNIWKVSHFFSFFSFLIFWDVR
jgi:L-serine dehydratase